MIISMSDALPYGSFSLAGDEPGRRVGVAVGDAVLDLTAAAERRLPEHAGLLRAGTLDALLAAGPSAWTAVREAVSRWVTAGDVDLRPVADVRLHLPFRVADYVDFFASEHHARNVAAISWPDAEPLPANWKHLPAGYHSRAGTVVVSGTPVTRPCGQRRRSTGEVVFGPSARLDLEAELGYVVGAPSGLGRPVPLTAFPDHVFGVCLLNDWSARDLQAWESTPLGPFLAKSFATSISPWVVPLAALEAARVAPPTRDVPLLPYLDDTGAPPWGLDVELELRLNGHLLSRPQAGALYWTGAQQLAHLTSAGACVGTGDLYGSGTASGPQPDQRGCLLELAWGGRRPVQLPDGTQRAWLEDGDEVSIRGTAPAPDGGRLSLGEVVTRIAPAP